MGRRQQNLQLLSVLLFQSIQGEIQFLTICMPGSHRAAGNCLWLGSWSGGTGNARGMPPAPHGLVFSTQGWITLKLQGLVCSH